MQLGGAATHASKRMRGFQRLASGEKSFKIEEPQVSFTVSVDVFHAAAEKFFLL